MNFMVCLKATGYVPLRSSLQEPDLWTTNFMLSLISAANAFGRSHRQPLFVEMNSHLWRNISRIRIDKKEIAMI